MPGAHLPRRVVGRAGDDLDRVAARQQVLGQLGRVLGAPDQLGGVVERDDEDAQTGLRYRGGRDVPNGLRALQQGRVGAHPRPIPLYSNPRAAMSSGR